MPFQQHQPATATENWRGDVLLESRLIRAAAPSAAGEAVRADDREKMNECFTETIDQSSMTFDRLSVRHGV